jgi:hypothetical protein
MDDDGSASAGRMAWTARSIVPWAILVAVLLAAGSFVIDFARSESAARLAGQGSGASTAATSTAPASVTTTVTGLVATVRTGIAMRSMPGTSTAVVATLQAGSVLQVMARQDVWFRVKDTAGHVGWIPNDVKYITVQAK